MSGGVGRGLTRVPKDLPLVMQSPGSSKGVGRGFGRGIVQTADGRTDQAPMPDNVLPGRTGANSSPVPGRTGAKQEEVPKAVPFKQALTNANQPLREFEENQALLKMYIPGLHIPGQNFPKLPEPQSNAAERYAVPNDLVRQYRSGEKHAVSAIMEYTIKLKLKCEFRDTPVISDKMQYFGYFGNTCYIEGKAFKQGIGATKKEAKTLAGKNAFDAILAEGFSIKKDEDPIQNEPETQSEPADAASSDGPNEPETFGNTTNSTAMFHEFCSKRGFAPVITIGDQRLERGFKCEITLRGNLIASEYGHSKKMAKNTACEHALSTLLQAETSSKPETLSHYDKVALMVRAKFNELRSDQRLLSDYTYSAMAAFVIFYAPEQNGEVVALATGNGCPKNEEEAPDGKGVIDCHAEVMARRAFVRYLVRQMMVADQCVKKNAPNETIFLLSESDSGKKFILREHISIHLYLSQAPCGDASAYPITNKVTITGEELKAIHSGVHAPIFDTNDQGCLRAKSNKGPLTVPIPQLSYAENAVQTPDEKLAADSVEFCTMSCSDKILKWNVVGLQGALASHLVEPIYLNSITVGYGFELGHFVRAVCCRSSEDINDKLPSGFRLNHPFTGRVSVYEPLQAERAMNAKWSNWSINWTAVDKDVEIVNSVTGKTYPDSPYRTPADPNSSRLCKMGFGNRFKNLAERLGCKDLINHANYGSLKAAAENYKLAKETLYKHLNDMELGTWIRKPAERDAFRLK